MIVLAAALALTFALLIFFFLPVHPSEVGIEIEDLTPKEMLVATAMENKELYDKIVTNNVIERSKAQIVDEVQKSVEYI
jgi:hypothetical protein